MFDHKLDATLPNEFIFLNPHLSHDFFGNYVVERIRLRIQRLGKSGARLFLTYPAKFV